MIDMLRFINISIPITWPCNTFKWACVSVHFSFSTVNCFFFAFSLSLSIEDNFEFRILEKFNEGKDSKGNEKNVVSIFEKLERR